MRIVLIGEKSEKLVTTLSPYHPKGIEEEAVRWTKELSRKKIDGKTLRERFVYRGLSFWWLMEEWLFESFAFCPRFYDVLIKTATYANMLDRETPRTVQFEGAKGLDYLCFSAACASRKIPLKAQLHGKEGRSRFQLSLIGYFFLARHLLRMGYMQLLRYKAVPEHPILVFPPHHWKAVFSPSEKRFIIGDPYTTPTVNILEKHASALSIEMAGEHTTEMGLGRMKVKSRISGHIPYEYFMRLSDFSDGIGVKRRFLKEARTVSKDLQKVKFHDVEIWPLLEPQFMAYSRYRAASHAVMLNTVMRAMEIDPRVVFFSAETGDLGKMIFYSASQKGIATVGMQHGIITNAMRVIREKGDGCPIPTVTGVYGEMDRDYLISCNYPPDRIRLIGNQRNDFLAFRNEFFDTKSIRKDLGIDGKVALLVTQMLPVEKERVAFITSVCEALARLDVTVLVKVHPLEKPEVYERLVQTTSLKRYVINRDYDTSKAVHASDLVIIYSSTVGMEALIMDKPLLVVNLTGRKDAIPYAQEGAALRATSTGEIRSRAKEALEGRLPSGMRQAMTKYVQRCVYKVDGKATERLAKLILETAKVPLKNRRVKR